MAEVKRATLFNPDTGKREAVDVGSQRSRDLFGQGYKLETNITNAPSVPSTAESVHSFNAGPTQQVGAYIPPTRDLGMGQPSGTGQSPQLSSQDPYLSFNTALQSLLRGSQMGTTNDLEAQRNALINARFNAKTDVLPDVMKRLSPSQQDAIRSGQVEGLNTQLAGVKTAISGRQEEQNNFMTSIDIARNLAKDAYTMEKGADSASAKLGQFIFQNVSNFDYLTPSDQQTVANSLGISVDSLRAMGASAKNQLAQEAQADKQAQQAFKQQLDLANLALKAPRGTTVVVGGNTVEGLKQLRTSTGGATPYKVSQDFLNDVTTANSRLRSGESWGSVWNSLKAAYPQYDNAAIDAALDQRYRQTGAFQALTSAKSEAQSSGTQAGKTNSIDDAINQAILNAQ